MPGGYKHRKWMAYLSVSASGPEFSPNTGKADKTYRPRMAADLKYTTADVDFLETHFKEPNIDSGVEEKHIRLRNPTCDLFFVALLEIGDWLVKHSSSTDWDGGGFQLCFAGHGCEGDGALVLSDGEITPEVLLDYLTSIARKVSSPNRLRISAVLDSCHSGAFILRLLDGCFNLYSELITPFHVFASCMEDEFAWEDSDLGHGLFSYCFSVHPLSLNSVNATAIQPDNSFGPSLAIAAGELGCSLLTAGAQNPIAYWNGTGVLEIYKQDIDLHNGKRYLNLDEMRTRVKTIRDKMVDVITQMQPHITRGKK